MKKEIKFRAIGLSGKWMYGMPTYDLDFIFSDDSFNSPDNYRIKSDTICQFIGLTDKNGNDIYEGDYLIDKYPIDEYDLSKGYHESLLPVVWCDKQLMWCVDVSFAKDGSHLTSLVEYFGEFLEIKGNIYESKN